MKFTINESVIDEIHDLILKSNFRTLWKNNDKEGIFNLCNEIREKTDSPAYDWKKFDEGWQYRNVLADTFKEAKKEFLNLVFGWW
jgi:hypothetical protein